MQTGGQDRWSPEPGEWLISDADRDQISAVLSQHMAEGRLTVDELDQRVGRLYESRTREQAAEVIADLPALGPPDPPVESGHFHIGHEHADAVPALPSWLTAGGLAGGLAGGPGDSRSPVSGPVTPVTPARPVTPAGPAVAAAPLSHAQERAAARKRAKQHEDSNAIGHSFQAARRAITSGLEAATAAGNRDEVQRSNDKLREAEETAESARRAVAAGDRAELQRLLARLRNLGSPPPGP